MPHTHRRLFTALVDDAPCKAALATHLHTGFVPSLAAALDRLTATPPTEEPEVQMMAATCEVLAFYLLHTPSKSTTGGKLLSSGALRALSQLFVRHALQHDSEALRWVMVKMPSLFPCNVLQGHSCTSDVHVRCMLPRSIRWLKTPTANKQTHDVPQALHPICGRCIPRGA